MKLRRHLEEGAGAEASTLGPAALDDLLERGDLESWAPLARAVLRDPRGPLAGTVLRLCEAHPMYGTSQLWGSWIRSLRGDPQGLAAVRRRRKLTQQQVAARLGITQSDTSKLERRRDLLVSTLRSYVTATGGHLRITARYGDEELELDPAAQRAPPARRR